MFVSIFKQETGLCFLSSFVLQMDPPVIVDLSKGYSDRLITKGSSLTWQSSENITEKQPCPEQDSNL
jgi:hypothetical protein